MKKIKTYIIQTFKGWLILLGLIISGIIIYYIYPFLLIVLFTLSPLILYFFLIDIIYGEDWDAYVPEINHKINHIKIIAIIIQSITYLMSIWRWFTSDFNNFWEGFKEFVWALCPIINFTYVWDIWFIIIFHFIPSIYRYLWNLV